MENVDKTIDSICTWIQEEMKRIGKSNMLPEMTIALANLVLARAKVKEVKSISKYKSATEELKVWKKIVND